MCPARLLVVEDEESLRNLLETYLVRLGYEVKSVASAEAALAVFRADPKLYAALVVDLSLPGMQGDELMMRVLAADSEIRVLLSSGYPFTITGLAPEARARAGFLQKPYLPKQLAEHLRILLLPRAASANPSLE